MTINKTYSIGNVSKIVIYGHGEKLCEVSAFVPCKIKVNSNGEETICESKYDYTVENVQLEHEPVAARKENLNRKDNYLLSYQREYSWQDRGLALYIHESEIGVETLGDILTLENDEERCFLLAFKLTFKHAVTITESKVERIYCEDTDGFEIPKGCVWSKGYGTKEHPCYDTFDCSESLIAIKKGINGKGIIKRWKESSEHENFSMIIVQHGYSKIEYSEERIRKDNLAKAMNESKLFHKEYSHYDIDKLEKLFGKLSLKQDVA